MAVETVLIRVYGIVQGVGFRPFISRIADAHHISGSVCNKGPYVEIVAQGTPAELDAFKDALNHNAPPRSSILKIDETVAGHSVEDGHFDIITSAKEKGDIFVSPDIAICDACKAELFDKTNRRYLHPFINCTACGPRLTILDSMPYDRERTSMGEFPMCEACHDEYTHAETRRYDAQPVCCHDCGPEVYMIASDLRRATAITETRRILAQGGLVAVKGIGGFHLCCDATNRKAVELLRTRKRRPVKPFAVMLKDMETAQRECFLSEEEAAILDGHQKPIILLNKKKGLVTEAVAPGNPKIGVMLPYAPLQLLLFTYDDDIKMPDALVMTSANESGAPICRTDEDAIRELDGLCDAILSHNRKIRLRADDTVMDFYDHKPYMIRRSRGYAPLPFMVPKAYKGDVLGIGGELKNSFCLAHNNLFYLSPYIGDLTDLRTVAALRESIERMETLLEISPSVVVCDLHPRYNSVLVAKEAGLPVLPVQHHYAHILSCMAENDVSGTVIGVSFDGTGYGPDRSIWGGEFLLCDYNGFRRVGAIEPFMQRGGDIAAKEGWRIAVSVLLQYMQDPARAASVIRDLGLCNTKEMQAQFFLADHEVNSILSTSAGRLFDAVSAILGFCRSSTFEGEAAMALEYAGEAWEKKHRPLRATLPTLDVYSRPDGNGKAMLYLPMLACVHFLAQSALQGIDKQELAYDFHAMLADFITTGCNKIRETSGISIVALSGGVFQNRLLLRLCDQQLQHDGFRVLKHSLVPPNDGGIALGQAVFAMNHVCE